VCAERLPFASEDKGRRVDERRPEGYAMVAEATGGGGDADRGAAGGGEGYRWGKLGGGGLDLELGINLGCAWIWAVRWMGKKQPALARDASLTRSMSSRSTSVPDRVLVGCEKRRLGAGVYILFFFLITEKKSSIEHCL